jgi:tellurite resistance protein TerC
MVRLVSSFITSGPTTSGHVDLDVQAWHWIFLLGVISILLLIDLLVIHRKAHVVGIREAAIESSVWIGLGLLFAAFVAWQFGASATGEYFGSYLMEKSLSVDNVFIWAMLFTHFQIPRQFQHRVLFWGIFGALVLRSGFIFGGLALIEIFEPALLLMGLFLVYTAFKLSKGDDSDGDFNPSEGRTLRLFKKVVPSTDEIRGHALFIRDEHNGLLATPLFAVLVLVELTDIVFAVDSVPAVLSVTSEQFIAISSNVFAILGLRALYFLLADVNARFKYLQRGIAIILAFVGVKMVLVYFWDWHVSTLWSLLVIVGMLSLSIGASTIENRRPS